MKKLFFLLKNTKLSYKEIGEQLNILEYTVGEINRGNNSWCNNINTFPIRNPIKKNVYKNKLNEENIKSIIFEIIFTNKTFFEIGEEYNVLKNTISDISSGKTWKNFTKNYKILIRKNRKENQKIYNQFMV